MDFVELRISTSKELADILIAELGEIGFETFLEVPEGIYAYQGVDFFKEEEAREIFERYSSIGSIGYEMAIIPKENWNDSWESNYHPIEIPGRCRVRASFHKPDPEYPLEIVINPKMSFGTGHHSTTWLMMEFLLDMGCTGKSVVDLGTGTGILAILAKKLGASGVDATDIDEWCIENSMENFALNDCSDIEVQLGSVNEVKLEGPYDLVLANINRNVLLEEMPAYSELLPANGTLLLSGFYEEDLPVIQKKTSEVGLSFVEHRVKEAWTAATFKKKGRESDS